ncbi:hypothetical protein EDB83DRAFT_2309915 [Lactarius deliciosus]|nr:hypothetical protein EDB83DRAFT_2309915 [Lactarius deliciosus]
MAVVDTLQPWLQHQLQQRPAKPAIRTQAREPVTAPRHDCKEATVNHANWPHKSPSAMTDSDAKSGILLFFLLKTSENRSISWQAERFHTVRPWTTSKRTIGRDVTARSSRNIGVLPREQGVCAARRPDAVGASNAGTQNDVILGWRGSRDQAVGVANLGIRLPRWPWGKLQGTSGVQSPARAKRCRKYVVLILGDVTSPLLWAAASKLSSRPKRKEDRTP